MRTKGMTLVELMIVIAIVAILSVVAGGAYRRYMDNARKSEVYSVFAEIRAKEEAYRTEFSSYLSTSGADTTYFPVLGACGAGSEPCAKRWNAPTPASWLALNLAPGKSALYCGYSVIAGAAGAAPGGTYGGPAFANQAPTVPWWYAVASCDNDGKPGVNATFVTTSDRDTVWEQNIHN